MQQRHIGLENAQPMRFLSGKMTDRRADDGALAGIERKGSNA
jgi:hypothetical protein